VPTGRSRKVYVVVGYKSTGFRDLSWIFPVVEVVFDQQNVTFVSVTHSFNTTTSMGR